MNEHEEHRAAMQEPERFTLELPPGHVGRRPFAAAREALRGVREAEDRFRPDLDRILAGIPSPPRKWPASCRKSPPWGPRSTTASIASDPSTWHWSRS